MKNNTFKFTNLCLSSFRDGQSPFTKIFPTEKQILEDLNAVRENLPSVKRIRTYSDRNILSRVPYLAKKAGFSVLPGCGISTNKHTAAIKIATLVKMYDEKISDRIIVGDMTLSRKTLTYGQLVLYLRKVRKMTNAKISTGNHIDAWIDNPLLLEEVDFICCGIYPYSEGVAVDKSMIFIKNKLKELKKLNSRNLPIILDSGWPDAGPIIKEAVPSLENQKIYIEKLDQYCKKNQIEFFVFEAFNENWKKVYEKRFDTHWGLFTEKRRFKYEEDEIFDD